MFIGVWQAAQCPAPSTRYWPRSHSADCGVAGAAVRSALQEQQVPSRHQRPEAEREHELVLRRLGFGGRARHQVRVERADVLLRHPREVRVGKRRVQQVPVARDAGVHRALEGGERPAADAGGRIGRDVGAVDRAEGRLQRQPARVGLAVGARVADHAVALRRDACALREQRLVVGRYGAVGQGVDGRLPCIGAGADGRSRDDGQRCHP
jgi:hypothetical protein